MITSFRLNIYVFGILIVPSEGQAIPVSLEVSVHQKKKYAPPVGILARRDGSSTVTRYSSTSPYYQCSLNEMQIIYSINDNCSQLRILSHFRIQGTYSFCLSLFCLRLCFIFAWSFFFSLLLDNVSLKKSERTHHMSVRLEKNRLLCSYAGPIRCVRYMAMRSLLDEKQDVLEPSG
jgi:hypothetical protein